MSGIKIKANLLRSICSGTLLTLAMAGLVRPQNAGFDARQRADELMHDRQFQEAIALLKQEIDRETAGRMAGAPDPLSVSTLLSRLADAYRHEHQYGDLEGVQRRLVEMWRASGPPEQIIVARSLSDLARTLETDQKFSDAEAALTEAVSILQRGMGATATATLLYQGRLAKVRARLGNAAGAEADFQDVLRLAKDQPIPTQEVGRMYEEFLRGEHREADADAMHEQIQRSASQPLEHLRRGVSAPRIVHKVEVNYTGKARKAKLQGTVIMMAIVDEKGKATNVVVVEPLGAGLDEQAVKTVQKWEFEPGMKEGKPVPVMVTIETSFRLF
jgi:TonB family protein